jgi:hypothetical protein
MATPGMLVRSIAKTLGVPAPTVTQFDRVLAENGLRSKSGRGNSAAQVTAKDAANLLIAIMASPVQGAAVRDAALTCQTYGGMSMLTTPEAKKFAGYGLHSLEKLALGCHFSQAMEALIREAADGGEFKYEDYGPDYEPGYGDRLFKIMVKGPDPWAWFQVGSIDEVPEFQFGPTPTPFSLGGDMGQARFVSYRTIRELGALLSGQPELERGLTSGSHPDDDVSE